ncbi:MAG: hypothetical protein J7M14_05710 [Planctomycetes bacterium]|nr:hypothetical protein [Planctomycetota bacterium]
MIGKALIPIAGLGTRLLPVSGAVPKAMFPLVDSLGRITCVLHRICAEVKAAGVEQVGLIVSPGQEEVCRAYFAAASGAEDLPGRIEYIVQEIPAGFGDAVALGSGFIGDESFLVLLGDHVHISAGDSPPCAAQVAKAFDTRGGAAMIGVQAVNADELPRVGTVRGEPLDGGVYRCTHFVEKPRTAEQRAALVTPGLEDGTYLAHCGIYGFTAEIFDCLAEAARAGAPEELELSNAQSILLERHPNDYYLLRISGLSLDTGTPAGYARTFEAIHCDG